MACIPIICELVPSGPQLTPSRLPDQDAPEPGRMCPKCHNVVGATSRTWFELFWIPLIPFSKKRIWICSICSWEMKQGDGPDPQPPGAYGPPAGGGYPPPPPQQYQPQQPPYYPPPPPPNK